MQRLPRALEHMRNAACNALHALLQAFRGGHDREEVLQRPGLTESVLLSEYVAGLGYEGRSRNVKYLRLGDTVWLQRDPRNPHDSNAIKVLGRCNRHLGFLRRELAATLAPHMDRTGRTRLLGRITTLNGDVSCTQFRVGVCFRVPREWLEREPGPILGGDSEQIRFLCDDSHTAAIYVSLTCKEDVFEELKRQMAEAGLAYTKAGPSFRPASNGIQYDWYLRLEREEGISRDRIEAFFKERFGVVSDRELMRVRQDRDEYAELASEYAEDASRAETWAQYLEQENEDLKAQIQDLRAELEWLSSSQAAGQALPEDSRALAETFLGSLLPNLRFLSDSVDVLLSQRVNGEAILRNLYRLDREPENVRGRKFESAPEWRELRPEKHGRLYYRKSKEPGAKYEVYISFKGRQREDERRLRVL